MVDELNLKRKVIRITWEKNIFLKEDKWYISIHNPLNMEEQNEIKNWYKKTDLG
jgi:hypothetical protein